LCARTVLLVCFLAHKYPAKPSISPTDCLYIIGWPWWLGGGGVLKDPYSFRSNLEGPVLLQSQLVSVFFRNLCL
jgi:hypothetical protein